MTTRNKPRPKSYQVTKVSQILLADGIVIVPTDTIYGMLASASSKKAIEKLYVLRKRDTKKPCIVLISQISDLESFGIKTSQKVQNILHTLWNDTDSISQKRKTLQAYGVLSIEFEINSHAITVVLPAPSNSLMHIHRGKKSIAFRIPSRRTERGRNLHKIINVVGPVLAPSANISGEEVAQRVRDAKKFFGPKVDMYLSCDRTLNGNASHIFLLGKEEFKQVR